MDEYLERLEEKITRLIGRYASLKVENAELSKRVTELENENQGIKKSRELARERLEALVKVIEGAEERF